MEETIFPAPAVAGILRESYVESRLHMDVDSVIARYGELQQRLVGTKAMPTYVLVEPESGRTLARQDGWLPNVERFSAFLSGPLSH
jgi:hypothetical protein